MDAYTSIKSTDCKRMYPKNTIKHNIAVQYVKEVVRLGCARVHDCPSELRESSLSQYSGLVQMCALAYVYAHVLDCGYARLVYFSLYFAVRGQLFQQPLNFLLKTEALLTRIYSRTIHYLLAATLHHHSCVSFSAL